MRVLAYFIVRSFTCFRNAYISAFHAHSLLQSWLFTLYFWVTRHSNSLALKAHASVYIRWAFNISFITAPRASITCGCIASRGYSTIYSTSSKLHYYTVNIYDIYMPSICSRNISRCQIFLFYENTISGHGTALAPCLCLQFRLCRELQYALRCLFYLKCFISSTGGENIRSLPKASIFGRVDIYWMIIEKTSSPPLPAAAVVYGHSFGTSNASATASPPPAAKSEETLMRFIFDDQIRGFLIIVYCKILLHSHERASRSDTLLISTFLFSFY